MNTLNRMLSTLLVSAVAVGGAAALAQDKNPAADTLPPGAEGAKQRLDNSPRHGEFVDIKVAGDKVPLRSYVVFPERSEKAPVVIVIHEIFGLTDWVRAVADQLAADGFIAIAPDLLSGMGPGGGGTEAVTGGGDEVRKLVVSLKDPEVVRKLDGVREYGAKLPASNGKTATVGYCWGGKQSFAYAVAQPALNAAVVYYGTSPEDPASYAKIKAPVLGLYGSDDARVNATIDPAKEAMTKANKSYTPRIYEGAGHGFLRQQDGKEGANLKAAQQAWPETVKFIREHCE